MPDDDPTLREFLELRIDHERELREAEDAIRDVRLESARREIDHRFEGVEAQEGRIGKLENFRENLTGRTVAIGIVGTIFVAVAASVITRAIFGG